MYISGIKVESNKKYNKSNSSTNKSKKIINDDQMRERIIENYGDYDHMIFNSKDCKNTGNLNNIKDMKNGRNYRNSENNGDDDDNRPFSSEYNLLEIQKNYSASIHKNKKSEPHKRHQSQNKIILRKTEKSTKNQKQQEKEDIHYQIQQSYQPNSMNNSSKNINNNNNNNNKQKPSTTKRIIKYEQQIKKTVKLNKKISGTQTQSNKNILNPQEILKLNIYFRYQPISIINYAGIRQQFMKQLLNHHDFNVIPVFNNNKKSIIKKDLTDIWMKLLKNAQLKGKYKYRERFNYAYSAQLKALAYKRKQTKKKKQSSSSEQDDQPKQRCRDMATWKKAMGVEGKVFIIKGKYPDLRDALLDRGWTQNQQKKSTFYDLRWTTKISDINFDILKTKQMVNHFNNNACLTSKYGIIKSLRTLVFPQGIDVDKFFPKAFDMSDISDFQNFLQVYKWIYCQSLLKKYTLNINGNKDEINTDKIKLAVLILQRRITNISTVVPYALTYKYSLCSPSQWKFLTSPLNSQKKQDIQTIMKAIQKISTNQHQKLLQISNNILEEIKYNQELYEPQYDLNGHQNIWIVKPAFLSRGRGIKCLAKFNDILDASLGKQTQYVVQKYIENPLIINQRKFDIRIWVLIEDYCPPKVWFYNQFYVRFCLQAYNPQTLKNRYAHLTNNSIQKYNSKISVAQLKNQSMWDRRTFQQYIEQNFSKLAFNRILSQMKQIIIATAISTADQISGRKGSFQLIGYDMMIDDNLNTWLIEINSSPAMDYSTTITRKLVAMVMQDLVKVVVDLREKGKTLNKGKNVGQFKCIYNGDGFKVKNYPIGNNKKNNLKQIKQHNLQLNLKESKQNNKKQLQQQQQQEFQQKPIEEQMQKILIKNQQ